MKNIFSVEPLPEPKVSEKVLPIQQYPYPIISITPPPLYKISKRSPRQPPDLDRMRIRTLSPEEIETQVRPYREQRETQTYFYKEMADINLDDNGQTITFTIQSRFFVFLDDDKYPLSQLKCEPEWIMGCISEGFFRGPELYPAYFEGRKIGKCNLQNGDFSVTIVVVERTPILPLQTNLPNDDSLDP